MTEMNQELPDYALLAQYEGVTDLVEACKTVRDAGFKKWDSYSPFPVHGIDPAMGIKMTRLPWLIFVMGITGTSAGILMQWWMNAVAYPFIISGKPMWSLPANIPVAFETTVLFAALTAIFATLAVMGLPALHHPLFENKAFARATDDKFFIAVEAKDAKYDRNQTEALLRSTGASRVELVLDNSQQDADVPLLLKTLGLFAFIMGTVPLMYIANNYGAKTPQPRVHPNPNMDFQEKFKTQSPSELFADGSSMRPPIEGTVAFAGAHTDAHMYRGLNKDGSWATTLPASIKVDEALMARGQERFNIYCRPCHGAAGKGNGTVQERIAASKDPDITAGWAPPTDLTTDAMRSTPDGRIFHTISNGGTTAMKGYAHAIPVRDRWAIVAYVRALQRSRQASVKTIPEDKRGEIQ